MVTPSSPFMPPTLMVLVCGTSIKPRLGDRADCFDALIDGLAATIRTPEWCSRNHRPMPISVPVVPRPATTWVTSGRSA